MHRLTVASHDHCQPVAVVFHQLKQGVDGLAAIIALATSRQRVGLVDEKHTAIGLLDFGLGLDSGLADIARHKIAALHLHHMALLQQTQRSGAVVGEPLVTHPKVAKVAFTGGSATGARVNELAARTFKKVSLELGGKSPNIVFDDAIIDDAVNGAVSGIFAASGQTCIAGSRLLLHEKIHDEFVEKLIKLASTAKLGDPSKFETQVGPVTTPPQYQKVLGYIDIAKGEGAKCVLGGGPATKDDGGGTYFVKPTIFTGVDNKMRIAQEEVFGPVLSVIKFKDDEHAVEIANDVIYGLGSGVWTQSVGRALTMARRIRAGTVWVNTYRAVSPMMPFGGYKASGLGRENGATAIDEYLQTKAVWINLGRNTGNPFVMKTSTPTPTQ